MCKTSIEFPGGIIQIPGDLTDYQIAEFKRLLKEEFEPAIRGVWVALNYDRSSIAIFDIERDALRYCVDNNYDDVIFWPFGESWQEATMRPKTQETTKD